VPGNTFTVNIVPTVALSSASISIANGSMNVISDNRSIPKISAIARIRPSSTTDVLSITDGLFAATQIFTVRSTSNADVLSVTDGQLAKQLFTLRDTSRIDQISRTDGSMTKQLFTLRDTSKTNYVNNSLVKGGGAGAASGISIREFRANIAQAGQTDTVSTTDGAIVKQLFTLRDTSRIDQISRTDGSMTKQLFVLRDSTVTVRKPDRAESNTGGNATANSSIVTTLSPTNLPSANIAQTYFYSVLAPGYKYNLSKEQGKLAASTTVVNVIGNAYGKLKSISVLRSPGTDRYVTIGGRLKSIASPKAITTNLPVAKETALYWQEDLIAYLSGAGDAQNQVTFTTVGAQTWTVPENVTSISVLVIGGGGGGPDQARAGGAGGGGGLAYANNITVVPGTTYNLFVGAGGTNGTLNTGSSGTAGSASWFNTSAYLFANGGTNGTASGLTSGTSGGGGGAAGYAAVGGAGAAQTGGVTLQAGGAGGTAGGTASTASFSGGAGGQGASGTQATLAAAAVTGGAGAGGSGSSSGIGQLNSKGGGGVGFLGQSSVDSSGATTTPGTATAALGTAATTTNGGSGGTSATDPNGGLYGGGGSSGGSGGQGMVRIIWSTGRTYPTTKTADQVVLDYQTGNINTSANSFVLYNSAGVNKNYIGRTVTVTSGTGSYPANTVITGVASGNVIYTSNDPSVTLSSAVLTVSTTRTSTTIAPTNARENLFYLRMAPGKRYSLSTEQGVRPTPTPFIANANSAIVTTTLRGSLAITPLAITTSGGTYTGFSGFTGYRIPAASAPSVQPGLIVTAAATASGTSVLSNTATVAFVSYVDAAATPAIYVFFPGTPISAWLNGYTMTLTYPTSTTIGNATTPTTAIDTYNRFLQAPGLRYSLSTEQGYRPTSPTVTDVVSTTDGLFSNVYLQNGFFIYAAQSGNVLGLQGAATGFPYQFGGSTIGTTYTQPFGSILKTGKTIYGPGGATATIVNQRFERPANYDVTLTNPAYSYTATTLTLPSVTGMYVGSPIRFSLAVFGSNITANTTYYVTSISGTTITLTTTSPGNANITIAAGNGSGTLTGNVYYGTVNQGQPQGYAQDATTSVYATYIVNTSQTVTAGIWFVPSDANFSNRPTNSRDSLNTFLMAPGLRYSLAKEQGEIDLHNNLASAATARGVLTNPALTAYQATNTQYWTASTYNTLPTAYRLKGFLTLGDVVKDVRLTVDNGKITAVNASSVTSVTFAGNVSSGTLTLYNTASATASTNNSFYWNGADGGWRSAVSGLATNITMCLEMWIYPTVAGTALWSSGQASVQFYHYVSTNADGSISLAYGSGSWAVTATDTIASAGSVTTNAWNHLAFMSDGSTLKCFVNGVLKGSSSNVRTQSGYFYFGSYFNNANNDGSFFRGYMKDVRYVTGSQVYSTSGFTPPYIPLTAISGTVFLNLQSLSDLVGQMVAYGTTPSVSTVSPFDSNSFGYSIPISIPSSATISGSTLLQGTIITGQISGTTYTVSPSQTNAAIVAMTYTSTTSSATVNYTNRPQSPRDILSTFQMAPGLRYSLSTEQGKIPTQPSNLRLVQDSFNPLVFKWGYGTKGGSMQDPSFKKKPPIQFWN
jgi:hypothetical protein